MSNGASSSHSISSRTWISLNSAEYVVKNKKKRHVIEISTPAPNACGMGECMVDNTITYDVKHVNLAQEQRIRSAQQPVNDKEANRVSTTNKYACKIQPQTNSNKDTTIYVKLTPPRTA